MVNRWSVVLLIVGVMAGYAISGTTLRAQDNLLPFAIGDTVTLRFGRLGAPSSRVSSSSVT